jgi:hypothetical protein
MESKEILAHLPAFNTSCFNIAPVICLVMTTVLSDILLSKTFWSGFTSIQITWNSVLVSFSHPIQIIVT